MQILAPDGTPIETAEQLAALQAAHAQMMQAQMPPPARMPQPDETHWQPNQQPSEPAPQQLGAPDSRTRAGSPPPVIPTRAPSTTIDALEREFERNKQRDLSAARSAGGTATAVATQRRTGEEIGRNDPCFCGSGKKYKKCHGATA
jgi:preprotein translocase subunit SecA